MKNKSKFQFIVPSFVAMLACAFFAFSPSVFASTSEDMGTIRVCSVLVNETGALANAEASTPVGSSTLRVSTTKTFSSTILIHTFNAPLFAHNTSINGIPVRCTDNVSVPFGQYYYDNPTLTTTSSAWAQSRYYDGVDTFSLASAAPYSNRLFTEDPSDDITVNGISDGLVVVDEYKPHRTIIVLNTYSNVLDNTGIGSDPSVDGVHNTLIQPAQCVPDAELILNGSFEHPVITNPRKWDIVSFKHPVLSWKSFDTSYGLELQAGIFDGMSTWLAHSGNQYAEIDGGASHDVSQDIATVPGATYTLSFWVSPRPQESASNNVMKVLINGVVVKNVNASTSPVTTWTNYTHTFIATSTVTRVSFLDGKDISTGRALFLDDVSLKCTQGPVNTRPTISLIGNNPSEVVVGSSWVEPGATANDLEDGSITNKIVITGTVDTSTTGTYTLTYTVTDSGGLSASTTRQVIVKDFFGDKNPGRVTICHAIQDPLNNNAFIRITISDAAAQAHQAHHGERDIIPATDTDCVKKPAVSLTAQPLAIVSGATTTLTWSSSNVTSCTSSWAGTVPLSGIQVVSPATTTVYAITCTGIYGSQTASTTVSVSVPLPVNQCVLPDTLGDTTVESIGESYGHEPSVATILSGYGMTVHPTLDQKQYQSFTLSSSATTTLTVTYLEGDYSAHGNVFGYYLNNDLSTFVPLFLSGASQNPAYPSVGRFDKGHTFTISAKASSIQFAVKSSDGHIAPYTISTVNSVNASGVDRVIAFNNPYATSANDFILAFEDLPSPSASDNDYNDVIVRVVITGCTEAPKNTPPTLTLLGANPATLTVGQPWIEPGATAYDLEDGNITHKIVITGTVDINTPGTYTLTYTVTDSGGLSASTTRQVIVSRPPVNACVLVSDTTTQVIGGGDAFLAYIHPNWVTIPHTSWVWSSYKVADPVATTTRVFSKTFNATSTPTSAVLSISADNSYIVKVNGVKVAENLGEFNYLSVATYNIASAIVPGLNTITFEVTNFAQVGATPESNPAGLIYKLELSGNGCGPVITNTPPTITLIGANPATLTVGQPWIEPGATATDLEDGNITNKIVITGTVSTTTPGTYTLIYTVTDSGGLSASTTRQVIVTNGGGGGPTTGKITFCSMFANKDNVIATSSAGLPFGSFVIKLATTTDIANSTLQTKVWNATSFAPTMKIILNQNDADCVTYDNLPFGNYYYSELGVTGSQWVVSSTSPKYNDQFNVPVNNIFDFFSYSPELFTATTTDDASRNVNADGLITLSADRREHTLVMVTKYADAPACMLPVFTSATTTSGEVEKAFSFTLSATTTASTTITYTVATSSLPAGLSFSGNTISGTPTASGTFSVVASASNPCGTTTQTVVITINPKQDICTTCGGGTPPPACTSNCGGGGGNGPVITSLTITNEKVVEITPGVALVTWNTNLPATKEVGYGTVSQSASFIVAPFGYATSTPRVSSPLQTVHSYTIAIERGKTYYFRPVSTDGKTTVAGIELKLTAQKVVDGGNQNSCYYLFDYLKQGWNNNPVEVRKLQVFLRDIEGFPVEVTGVYDDQTVTAVNAFQNRYKNEILTPWGYTAPTSFTYITTKKKVNEIYCKMAFPVTTQQQAEIDAFRTFLLGLTNAGVTLENPTVEQLNQPVIIDTNEVGVAPVREKTVATSTIGTLASVGVQSTTTPAGRLTANVIESGKKLGNLAAAIFTWPWGWTRGWFGARGAGQCEVQSVFAHWFNWVLIIVIITMAYLWYRERKANREALEINEELDLINK